MNSWKKIQKKHRKERVKIAKRSLDCDYGYLNEYVFTTLRNMLEWYEHDRKNVMQCDDDYNKTVASLRGAVAIMDQIDHLYDDMPKINNIEEFNRPFTDEERAKVKEKMGIEPKLYQQLYTYIGKHMQEWWD